MGSCVFNLAALLGLGSVVARRIDFHRKVVIFGGAVGIWTAVAASLVVGRFVGVITGLVLVLFALGISIVVMAIGPIRLEALPYSSRWSKWLAIEIDEEESDLHGAFLEDGAVADIASETLDKQLTSTGRIGFLKLRSGPGGAVVAMFSLALVVGSSVVMERTGSDLGGRLHMSQIVIGGIVLAVVTSLPNLVAAVYLARRGRGAATLSTTLNSNNLNIAVGLLGPALLLGLGPSSGQTMMITIWYLVLTLFVLVFAYLHRGFNRSMGVVVILAYLVFTVMVIAG